MSNKSEANIEVKFLKNQQLINGKWCDSISGKRLEVICPANKKVITTVPQSNSEDVNAAVSAARQALPSWSKLSAMERGALLIKIAAILNDSIEDISRIVAHETGNAIKTQTRPEVSWSSAGFRYFGGVASSLTGKTLNLGTSVLSYTRWEPHGVVGAIIPWNSPMIIAVNKIAASLAAGNTIVLKAAEDAPLGVLHLAAICNEVLPDGVVNVITGYGEEAGAALARHPGIDKMSFTGSTAVGKEIMRVASERILPVSLELGGKSPVIVCDDIDSDWIVDEIMFGMRITRQSQSCTAGSRVFIHEEIFDSTLEKLKQKMDSFVVGDPLSEKTDIGTVINHKQHSKICDYIQTGLTTDGVELVAGGLPPTDEVWNEGYYVRPTIFKSKSNNWRLAQEEIFGPVLVAIPWSDEADVIRMANDTHYGLAAYVFSKSVGRAIKIAQSVDAGWVQVNQGRGQLFGQPYGGFKQSGIGKEFSIECIENYSRLKSITVNLDNDQK